MLQQPAWLLMCVPVLVMCWFWRTSSRVETAIRTILLCLLLFVLAGPRFERDARAGSLIVVADRSTSMPTEVQSRLEETLQILEEDRPHDARLGLVSFGTTAMTEGFSESGPPVIAGVLNPNGSNLEGGLQRALSLIPPDQGGRVLVISDGRWTGRDPQKAAADAAARGIAMDFRELSRGERDPVAVVSVDAPREVAPGEGFVISAWVRADVAQKVVVTLMRDGLVMARGDQSLRSGANRLAFRDLASEPGTHGYVLLIEGDGPDGIPENNRAEFILGVRGPKPVLPLGSSDDSMLPETLRRGNLALVHRDAGQMSWNLTELSRYSAVVLENVPASDIGERGLEILAAWVRESGGGLLVSGGENSFGPGGYYRSPLDPLLPVSMELRREHRKESLCIVIALDRSGSMGAAVSGHHTKMDLANLASAEVLHLLSSLDEYGHIVVDSEAHVVINRRPATQKAAMRGRILSVESAGGGIFVYEALSHAARMILSSQASSRHIILFADAADAEQPGQYRRLLAQLGKADITVSVVGLGNDQDVDAPLLSEIAQLGGGRVYFTQNPKALPRIFAQETFVVARSAFIKELTSGKFTPGMTVLGPREWSAAPRLNGYNLTYARDEANLAWLTADDHRAPLLATWHAGTGRVAAFTGEAAGTFSGDLLDWSDYGHFWATVTRWCAGAGTRLPDNSVFTQELDRGVLRMRLHLDPLRDRDPFDVQPTVSLLRTQADRTPSSEELRLVWESPDVLQAELTLEGRETVLPTLHFGQDLHWQMAPVRLPYSPEAAPSDGTRGRVTLERLASFGGGRERLNLGGYWRDVPLVRKYVDLRPWFCLAALLLILGLVAERRTGHLAGRLQRSRLIRTVPTSPSMEESSPSSRTSGDQTVEAGKATPVRRKTDDDAGQRESGGLGAALNQARDQADKRIGK